MPRDPHKDPFGNEGIPPKKPNPPKRPDHPHHPKKPDPPHKPNHPHHPKKPDPPHKNNHHHHHHHHHHHKHNGPGPGPSAPPGCRNGDPNCGHGYICDRCYNNTVQPMGYAGVNRNAPPPAPVYCQPVVQCRRWC